RRYGPGDGQEGQGSAPVHLGGQPHAGKGKSAPHAVPDHYPGSGRAAADVREVLTLFGARRHARRAWATLAISLPTSSSSFISHSCCSSWAGSRPSGSAPRRAGAGCATSGSASRIWTRFSV